MKKYKKDWWAKRQVEIDALPKIPCACGCGEFTTPITLNRKPKRYIKGHSTRGKKLSSAGRGRVNEKPLTANEKSQRHRQRKKAEIDAMPQILCACGCGTLIAPFSKKDFKPAQYAHGHNPHGAATRFQKGQKPTAPFLPGALHPQWNGGVSTLPYGKEFTRRFKRLIRERDSYTCQRCGITQAEYGHTLEVHHLDHDKMNNDPSNLVTACGRCNKWASRNRDMPFML